MTISLRVTILDPSSALTGSEKITHVFSLGDPDFPTVNLVDPTYTSDPDLADSGGWKIGGLVHNKQITFSIPNASRPTVMNVAVDPVLPRSVVLQFQIETNFNSNPITMESTTLKLDGSSSGDVTVLTPWGSAAVGMDSPAILARTRTARAKKTGTLNVNFGRRYFTEASDVTGYTGSIPTDPHYYLFETPTDWEYGLAVPNYSGNANPYLLFPATFPLLTSAGSARGLDLVNGGLTGVYTVTDGVVPPTALLEQFLRKLKSDHRIDNSPSPIPIATTGSEDLTASASLEFASYNPWLPDRQWYADEDVIRFMQGEGYLFAGNTPLSTAMAHFRYSLLVEPVGPTRWDFRTFPRIEILNATGVFVGITGQAVYDPGWSPTSPYFNFTLAAPVTSRIAYSVFGMTYFEYPGNRLAA